MCQVLAEFADVSAGSLTGARRRVASLVDAQIESHLDALLLCNSVLTDVICVRVSMVYL